MVKGMTSTKTVLTTAVLHLLFASAPLVHAQESSIDPQCPTGLQSIDPLALEQRARELEQEAMSGQSDVGTSLDACARALRFWTLIQLADDAETLEVRSKPPKPATSTSSDGGGTGLIGFGATVVGKMKSTMDIVAGAEFGLAEESYFSSRRPDWLAAYNRQMATCQLTSMCPDPRAATLPENTPPPDYFRFDDAAGPVPSCLGEFDPGVVNWIVQRAYAESERREANLSEFERHGEALKKIIEWRIRSQIAPEAGVQSNRTHKNLNCAAADHYVFTRMMMNIIRRDRRQGFGGYITDRALAVIAQSCVLLWDAGKHVRQVYQSSFDRDPNPGLISKQLNELFDMTYTSPPDPRVRNFAALGILHSLDGIDDTSCFAH